MFRPHQIEAGLKIKQSKDKAFLLADECGLGKTRVACDYAKDFKKVLIVAPLSTIGGWLSEAEAVGLNLKQANKVWPDSDYVVINYDKLMKFPEHIAKLSGGRYIPYTFDLIVWDESHFLKSFKSKRHKIWMALNSVCKKTLYMTATPAQSPLEMKYLCDIIGVPVSQYWSWVKSFKGIVQPRWGGFLFRYGHPDDKSRLNGILNSERSMRRTPDQIEGWPEMNRIITPVVLTTTETKRYQSAFEDYRERLETSGKSINPKAEQLVAVGQFKQKISEIKLPYTLDFIKNTMEEGKVAIVSCFYKASVSWLLGNLQGLNIAVITGETSNEERFRIIEKSRMDALDVIIFSVKEGINLQQMEDFHRQRVQIDHDIHWSAMDQHQIDQRTHRAGRSANVYWMTCKNTIDDRIAKVLKNKMDSMQGMLDYKIEAEELLLDTLTKTC